MLYPRHILQVDQSLGYHHSESGSMLVVGVDMKRVEDTYTVNMELKDKVENQDGKEGLKSWQGFAEEVVRI